MQKLNTTRHTLPPQVRQNMVDLLNARLADSIDLFNQVKQAHWNVKGPSFIALHELFDDVAERVEEFSDMLAERAVALGGIAEGTSQAVKERTSLKPFPTDTQGQQAVVTLVSDALADFGTKARQAADQASEAGDEATSDLFVEITRTLDKDLWFVEAHLA